MIIEAVRVLVASVTVLTEDVIVLITSMRVVYRP